MDSYIISDRARAELAAKISQTGEGVNVDYVSLVVGVKPTDYVADTGLAIGSYPVADGVMQRVKWNDDTGVWDDFGSPFATKDYVDDNVSTLATDIDLLTTEIDDQIIDIKFRNNRKRDVIAATSLVALDLGDDPLKDNTAALQTLMDRPTRDKELIVFPDGVIMHREIELKDGFGWMGSGETEFKLLPITQDDIDNVYEKNDISVFNGSTTRSLAVNFTVNGNKDEHTGALGNNCEGVNFTGGEYNYFRGVRVKDVVSDGFDLDSVESSLFEDCVVNNVSSGFHNSTDSKGNIFKRCLAWDCSGFRGGFTSTENSLGENVFLSCISIKNDRVGGNSNYEIKANKNGVSNNRVIDCISDYPSSDDLSGVYADDLEAHNQNNRNEEGFVNKNRTLNKGQVAFDEVENVTLKNESHFHLNHEFTGTASRKLTVNINGGLPTRIGTILYLTMYSYRENTDGSNSYQHRTQIHINGEVFLDTGQENMSALEVFEAEASVAAILTEHGWKPVSEKYYLRTI